MMEINNTTRQPINSQKLRLLAAKFLLVHKKSGASVSLAIVGPVRMRQLNKRYRKIDKTTDVLSFPSVKAAIARGKAGQAGKAVASYLGEVIINRAEADKITKYQPMLAELGLNLKRHRTAVRDYIFYFLFIHGLLHLIGYDDAREQDRHAMLRLGKKFLDRAGIML